MAVTAATPSGFGAWYRRFYLLVNVPILLVLTELAFVHWRVAERLPFQESNDLEAALARYDASPPAKDAPVLVLLGNSAIREGIDQHTIEQGLSTPTRALRAYNFGLSAARVDDEFDLFNLMLARGIRPRIAVIGVNPFLVDDEINPDTTYPWVERHSPYVYFHRSRFRTSILRSAVYLLSSKKKKVELRARWDADEQFKCNRAPKDESGAALAKTFAAEFGKRAPSEYPMIARLTALVKYLDDHGVTTYVVMLPMNPVGTKIATYAPLQAAVKAAVPPDRLLDLEDRLPADHFHDMGHVNEKGRDELTAAVLAWLQTRKELR